MELTVGKRTYVTGRLDAFKQMNVAAKLAPMMMAIQKSFASLSPEDFEAAKIDEAKAEALFASSGNSMIEAFSKMSNEDRDYIVGTCLDVCQARDPTTGGLSPVRVQGRMMFDDLGFQDVLRLAFVVVKENLGDFFLNPLGDILPSKA